MKVSVPVNTLKQFHTYTLHFSKMSYLQFWIKWILYRYWRKISVSQSHVFYITYMYFKMLHLQDIIYSLCASSLECRGYSSLCQALMYIWCLSLDIMVLISRINIVIQNHLWFNVHLCGQHPVEQADKKKAITVKGNQPG